MRLLLLDFTQKNNDLNYFPPQNYLHSQSDILQVISGKETKLKGTKKDPNCGFCQNHGVKILRKGKFAQFDSLVALFRLKSLTNCLLFLYFSTNNSLGHVRSCGFGQERHFKLDNCFDCEVHYIRNEVNRLQIKMRRAMKEDRTLSEEQRKTAREAITRDEVEKGKFQVLICVSVCDNFENYLFLYFIILMNLTLCCCLFVCLFV